MWGSQILAFGVAVCYWPGLISSATAPRWCLLAVALPLISWLDPRAIDWRILAIAVVYLAYAALSLLWAPDVLTGANDLFRLLIIAAAFLAGAAIDDLDQVIAGLAWGVALSLAVVLLQIAGTPLIVGTEPASGLFYNREVLGETAAPLLVWALCMRRWTLSSLLAVTVALTLSRVGMVSAVGALTIMYPRRAWLPLLIAGIGAVWAYTLHLPPFTPDKLASGAQRLMVWGWALNGISFLGKGIGSFAAIHPDAEYAHSDLLQLGFETGLIGIAVGVVLFVALWRRSRGAQRALLIALGIEAAISFPLHMPVIAFVSAVLAGSLTRAGDLVRPSGYVSGGGLEAFA
jgi:hypothetical protein